VVVGLLCDGEGTPLSIEVFAGNTQDPKTFIPQVKKVAQRFGEVVVTFVGDRGRIKSEQIEALGEKRFHYITAITKPQIEALLNNGPLHIGLFDESLAEVKANDGVRYVLRRNPTRKEQVHERYNSMIKFLSLDNGITLYAIRIGSTGGTLVLESGRRRQASQVAPDPMLFRRSQVKTLGQCIA
jgi:transposase